jgi:biopolymer transport protein ExbD
MGSLEFERRKRSSADLNMTPLIDMVFLLLIFFILSSHFISEQGFKVKLPKAVHSQPQKNENITIFINADEEIFVNDGEVPVEKLQGELVKCLERSDSKTVIIKADESVNLKLAVRIMDIAKAASAGGLVISTQSTDDENDK